jgi:hypothetical protein
MQTGSIVLSIPVLNYWRAEGFRPQLFHLSQKRQAYFGILTVNLGSFYVTVNVVHDPFEYWTKASFIAWHTTMRVLTLKKISNSRVVLFQSLVM